MTRATLLERIDGWLREQNGKCVCDECIARATGDFISRSVARVASRTFARDREFSRFHGKCDLCGGYRMINAYRGRRWM